MISAGRGRGGALERTQTTSHTCTAPPERGSSCRPCPAGSAESCYGIREPGEAASSLSPPSFTAALCRACRPNATLRTRGLGEREWRPGKSDIEMMRERRRGTLASRGSRRAGPHSMRSSTASHPAPPPLPRPRPPRFLAAQWVSLARTARLIFVTAADPGASPRMHVQASR